MRNVKFAATQMACEGESENNSEQAEGLVREAAAARIIGEAESKNSLR